MLIERVEFDAEHGKDAMNEARRVMDTAYHDLVAIVNLGAKRDTEGVLSEFINMTNVEVGRFRTYTGQGQAGSTSGSDSDTVRMRTARFELFGGRIETITAEVGSALNAPANTKGYRWEPEVPAAMPDKNTTYREVLISAEMFTATFHFLDHREEEIRQLVGSILNAPANTTGCIWDPAVPDTMPAENTVYYEIPDETQTEEPILITALFKFHSGQEEEVKAEAGAPLTAPQNTEGYRWKPAVPAVMPAENTTYTEVSSDSVDWGEGPGGDDPDL